MRAKPTTLAASAERLLTLIEFVEPGATEFFNARAVVALLQCAITLTFQRRESVMSIHARRTSSVPPIAVETPAISSADAGSPGISCGACTCHPVDRADIRPLSTPGRPIEGGQAAPPPAAYGPVQLRSAYGFDNTTFGGTTGDGTGQTIAIVDAYDDPSLVDTGTSGFGTSDLAKFDAYYHLPDPPSFTKVNQDGDGSFLPETDHAGPGTANWEVEEALDVEYAHAMAPMASIALVEANDPTSLYTAVQTAASLTGVSVVLMSWGESEYSGETQLDAQLFGPLQAANPGITFLAATGANGAPGLYPAYSPYVLAAGGTSLSLGGSNLYGSEVGWSGSGGGISQFEAEPTYQDEVQSTGQRTIPDVSFDADPNTGVAIYDSYNNVPGGIFGDSGPWEQVGGTSLAAAGWAGLIAVADQGQVLAGGAPQRIQTNIASPLQPDLYRF